MEVGRDVQARELECGWFLGAGRHPADDSDDGAALLRDCDLAGTAYEAIAPAHPPLVDADPIEVRLRDQATVGLAPALGLESRDCVCV